MTLRLDSVGFRSPSWTRRWTSTDSLLYAVAVGAGPDDLALSTENSEGVVQRAVPSYAALLSAGNPAVRDAVGSAWDPVRLVYAGQQVTWHRELPPEGAVEMCATVAGITDKGTGALVHVDTDAIDPETGAPMFTARRSVFLRGVGGFDGARPPEEPPAAEDVAPPAPVPAEVVRHRLPDNQALLYRLCGDRHPLHSDPAFARRAGFDRPILHGLCTWGVTAMLLLRNVLGGDPARMASLEGRFRTPVWPGDVLELHWRRTGPGEVAFRALRVGAARPAIDDGVLRFRCSRPAGARP